MGIQLLYNWNGPLLGSFQQVFFGSAFEFYITGWFWQVTRDTLKGCDLRRKYNVILIVIIMIIISYNLTHLHIYHIQFMSLLEMVQFPLQWKSYKCKLQCNDTKHLKINWSFFINLITLINYLHYTITIIILHETTTHFRICSYRWQQRQRIQFVQS